MWPKCYYTHIFEVFEMTPGEWDEKKWKLLQGVISDMGREGRVMGKVTSLADPFCLGGCGFFWSHIYIITMWNFSVNEKSDK